MPDAAYALELSPLGYFELPDKTVPMSFRSPESLKLALLGIVRLWRAQAISRGMNPKEAENEIDLTFVCNRLLKVGVDGVWKEAGSVAGLDGMPRSDEEWTSLERAILKDGRTKK